MQCRVADVTRTSGQAYPVVMLGHGVAMPIDRGRGPDGLGERNKIAAWRYEETLLEVPA